MSIKKFFLSIAVGAVFVATVTMSTLQCVRTDVPNPPQTDSTAAAPRPFLSCEIKELPADVVKERGVGYRGHYWTTGQALKVGFIGTVNPTMQDYVKQHAVKWSQWANIDVVFPASAPYDIRVTFDMPGQAWSYLGSDAKYVSVMQPTISIGWRDADGRVVIHEFGHALGLKHEQQHARGICWNKPVVYADMMRTNGWSQSTTDLNILLTADAATHDTTTFDKNSVMLYDIRPTWTFYCTGTGCTGSCTSPGPAYVGGPKISLGDAAITAQIYPGRGVIVPPIGPTGNITLTPAQIAELKQGALSVQSAVNAAKVAADAHRARIAAYLGQ